MAVALVVLVVVALIYWFPVRTLFTRWGTTPEERSRGMAGDGWVDAPTWQTTLAVTVDAPARAIWPWIVQMGYQRGGLYSYDWLDRIFGYLDRPSASILLPEFQDLAPGDTIPIGRGGGFPVVTLEPARSLVLGGTADGTSWSWELALVPLDASRTRLVSRNRARVPMSVSSWALLRVLEPAAFLMTRRMLIGIRDRAEAHRHAGTPHGTDLAHTVF